MDGNYCLNNVTRKNIRLARVPNYCYVRDDWETERNAIRYKKRDTESLRNAFKTSRVEKYCAAHREEIFAKNTVLKKHGEMKKYQFTH